MEDIKELIKKAKREEKKNLELTFEKTSEKNDFKC